MVRIDANTIVTHSNDNLVALVGGRQLDLAGGWFALLNADVRCLDSVIDGVAHEVQ